MQIIPGATVTGAHRALKKVVDVARVHRIGWPQKFHHCMAQVKIEDIIVTDLSREMRNALEEAVREVLPDADFDRAELFRAFKRAVRRKCSTWEQVRDNYVKGEP